MRECYFKERGIAYRIGEFLPHQRSLILLHGLTGSASAWFPYESELEFKFNLLTLDLRGHGKSIRPLTYESYALGEFATDVSRLLVTLGLQDVIVVGHSLGALVALELLITIPAIKGAIFLSPIYGLNSRPFARITKILLKFGVNILSNFTSRPTGGRVDYERFKGSGDWNLCRIVSDLHNTGVHTYIFCLSQLVNASEDEKWQLVDVPVVVLHGGMDTIVPFKNAQDIASLIQGVELYMMPDADHMLVLNKRDEILTVIEHYAGGALTRRPGRRC